MLGWWCVWSGGGGELCEFQRSNERDASESDRSVPESIGAARPMWDRAARTVASHDAARLLLLLLLSSVGHASEKLSGGRVVWKGCAAVRKEMEPPDAASIDA